MSETMQMKSARQARDVQTSTESPAEMGTEWEEVSYGTHWIVTDFNGFKVCLEQTDGDRKKWVSIRRFPAGYVRE